jgi:peptidyl-prolyl cis-trans isomerase C
MVKRGLVLILAFSAVIPAVWARGKAEGSESTRRSAAASKGTDAQEQVVAVVNGTRIQRKVLDREVTRASFQYMMQGIVVEGENLELLRQQVLQDIIDQELIYQAGTGKGIKADEALVTIKLQEIRSNFPDEEAYASALLEEGMTEQELLADIRRVLVIQAFIEREFASKITLAEAEKRKFYEDNPEYFLQPEQVRASHILVEVAADAGEADLQAARTKIEALRARIAKGEAFADVAREASDCPSAAEGGDLGFFGRGDMVPEFEEAAFALEPGQMSGVVKTDYGYHLIVVTEKTPEEKIPYEDMEAQIEEYLRNGMLRDKLLAYIDTLRRTARIETFLEQEE